MTNMDVSRSPSSLHHFRASGLTPNKSPTTEKVQRRRLEIEQSERAAYWALFNTSAASLLYYDLCYMQVLTSISILLSYLGWVLCATFTASACYDFYVHFWSHTFMRPIIVSPAEKLLEGIGEDELGFKVEETPPVKFEPVHDNLPPFEIHYSFEENEKVITPQKKQQSPDSSINTSRVSKVVDKESLVEYLKNCQLIEDELAELREAEMKQTHC